jgi:xanthine dehydrogenase YagS FAD-binding subunit
LKPISIYTPTSIEEAMEILSQHGAEAAIYAGGTDILIRLKNRLDTSPKYLVDIKKIKQDLKYVRKASDGSLKIGALVPLSEIANSELVKNSYPIFEQALLTISSPELRNQSTLGGDLLQEVWCPYYRNNYPCWRNGGEICQGEIGDNAIYQSIMGAKLSYAVYPGDAAIALAALDASVSVATPSGNKTLEIEELLPGAVKVDGKVQSSILRRNEILTEVSIPPPKPGVKSYYEKVRQRKVWDFALASIAAVLQLQNGIVKDARIVLGGIATLPFRERVVEELLKEKGKLDQDLIYEAAAKALSGAKPLKYNGYKLDMAKNLIVAALESINGDN